MIDNEDYLNDEDSVQDDAANRPPSLDVQEQQNSFDLTREIEDQNSPDFDESDEILNNSIENTEGTSDFLERSIPEGSPDIRNSDDDTPLTKNLRGDNPPGSEQQAFEAGLQGDTSSRQVKYNAQNIQENFRENLDKTSAEVDLHKKLKGNTE